MCYTAPISYGLAVIGFVTAGYITAFSNRLRMTHIQWILVFYGFMELLQGIQYAYVNNCSHFMNKVLTEIAYMFVVVQPFIWNLFFYVNSDKCEKNYFAVGMAIALVWMFVHILSRLMYRLDHPKLTKVDSTAAGTQTCTRQQVYHLYWEWPMYNFGEFRATYLTHLLIWFVPALLSSRFRMAALILVGSAIVSGIIVYMLGEPHVFTSAWCWVSVPIVLFVLLSEVTR